MDSNIIEAKLKEALSDSSLEKYLGKRVKNKIKLYAELENYTLNQLLPASVDYIIILIEDKTNHGHWVCLTKDDHTKTVTFFDSYGVRPGGQLNWVSSEQNKKLDNELHDIFHLLDQAYNAGYSVLYNKKRFQSSDPAINTCGRHVVFYLKQFLKNRTSISSYINLMEKLKRKFKTDADHVVAYYI